MCLAHQKTKMAVIFCQGAMVGGVKQQMWVGSGSCSTNGCTFPKSTNNYKIVNHTINAFYTQFPPLSSTLVFLALLLIFLALLFLDQTLCQASLPVRQWRADPRGKTKQSAQVQG